MKNQEENIELQKKVYGGSFVRGITFLTARPRSFVVFCRFFDLLGFYEEEEIFLWKIVGDLGPSWPPPPPPPAPPHPLHPHCLKACYLQLLIIQYLQGMFKNVWQFI